MSGRLLGVDYGTIRIGLAISDNEQRIASPLATYKRRSGAADALFFKELVTREEVGGVIVGLPLHLDDRESPKSAEVRTFAKWLADQTGIPVTLADERFSSVEAEHALWNAGLTHKKRKARRDQIAAQIVLQAYLDDKHASAKD